MLLAPCSYLQLRRLCQSHLRVLNIVVVRRFFPSVYYLSTSKVAIAVLGNMAFALALTLYNLTTKVGCALLTYRQHLSSQIANP